MRSRLGEASLLVADALRKIRMPPAFRKRSREPAGRGGAAGVDAERRTGDGENAGRSPVGLVFGCGLGVGVAVGAGLAETAGPVAAWLGAIGVMGLAVAWEWRRQRGRAASRPPSGTGSIGG